MMINTPRLTIQPLTLADAAFILRLLNEESFIRYIADKQVRSLADAENYLLNGPMQSYQTFGFGLKRVTLNASGESIGMCGLLKRPELDYPDLGYALLPEYCGQGYAFEAAKAVLEAEMPLHHLDCVQAVTLPDNHSSNQLLQRLGLELLGTLELYGKTNNHYEYRV